MNDVQTAPPGPAIVQYWDAEVVPDYLVGPIATFRDLNPDLDHRVFNETSAGELIAAHFGARELAAFNACAVPCMQSDYFRYCAVHALGGVYADVDFRCLRPLRPLMDRLEAGEIFLGPTPFVHRGREAKRVWSQFFAFREPGHPFLRMAQDIATANMEQRIAERVWRPGEHAIEAMWLTVGPGVVSLMRLMREWGSFDEFLDGIVDSFAEPFGLLYCEVVGDYDRLLEAFEGVRVSPHEEMEIWVEDIPWSELPYKETDVHWHNVKTTIFR